MLPSEMRPISERFESTIRKQVVSQKRYDRK